MFTVYPAVGSVPAGGAVQVTVDMIAENPGFCEEVGASNRGIALFFEKREIWETMVNLLERKIRIRFAFDSSSYLSESLFSSTLFLMLWALPTVLCWKIVSLRNRTAERGGLQNVFVWRTWEGYYLRVLSWSSLKSGVLQKDLFKGRWSLEVSFLNKVIVTLVTWGLPSSFLSRPVA